MRLPAGISRYAAAIIAVLLYFSDTNHAITVLAPGQDVYVLVTMRNDTTYAEFKEMLGFYLDIQANCLNCTPPITNLPSLMFFGEVQEDFTQSLNVTASIVDIMNSAYFENVLYKKSLSTVNDKMCTESCPQIEFLLDYIATDITKKLDSMETRLRKKKISIITNYYYSLVPYHLNQSRTAGFNVTYINYFVPNVDVLNMEEIGKWPFPVQVFSCAMSETAASRELYLNQDIDFTPDPSLIPITGFIDIGYYNLITALGFFNAVFNQGLCKYTTGQQYYEMRFLVHYSGFHVENIVLVPFLGNYTATYFTTVVSYLIDNLLNNIGATHPVPDDTPAEDYTKIDESATNCEAAFYDAFVARVQLKSDANGKPLFTFFVSDAMPSCAVKGLQAKGVLIGSYLNHVEIILHNHNGTAYLDPSEVFNNVTNVIFDKDNVTEKGNHVYVTDLSKHASVDLLGICEAQVLPVLALHDDTSPESPAKRFKWAILGGWLGAVTVLIIIFVAIYLKRVEIGRLRRQFLQQHDSTHASGVHNERAAENEYV